MTKRPSGRRRGLRSASSIAGAIALAVLVAACGSSSSGSSSDQGSSGSTSASTTGGDCKTVTVASQEPLSGDLATLGIYLQRGFSLGAEAVNAAGGVDVAGTCYKINAKLVDNQSDPTHAVSATQQLLTDGTKYMFGPVGTALFAPAFEQVAGTDTLVMGIPAIVESLQAKPDGKYLFDPIVNTAGQLNHLVPTMMKQYSPKRIAVLQSQDDAGDAMFQTTLAALKTAGANVVYQRQFSPTTRDFSSYIAAIKATNADAVIGPYLDQWLKPILTQAATAGFTSPAFIGTVGATLDSVNPKIQRFMYPVVALPVGDPTTTDPKILKFQAAYKAKYGEAIPNTSGGNYAGVYYDPVQMLAQAMKVAGSTTDLAKISAALITDQVTSYPTRLEDLTFNAKRQADYPVTVGLWENGKASYVPAS